MIHNLKVLLLAAMALTAFGALNVASAHAAEKFHCSVEPCRVRVGADGTGATEGATRHQVFVIKDTSTHSTSITCESISGEATSANKEESELRLENIAYNGPCTMNGSGNLEVNLHGCTYKFRSEHGAQASTGAKVAIECPTAAHIQITVRNEKSETLCTLEVTPQEVTGVRYHNIPTGAKTEVTVEAAVPGVAVESPAGNRRIQDRERDCHRRDRRSEPGNGGRMVRIEAGRLSPDAGYIECELS